MTYPAPDLENMFGYHPATAITGPQHDRVREVCRTAAEEIVRLVQPSPERTTAINKLREAMFYANAAIACNTPPMPSAPESAICEVCGQDFTPFRYCPTNHETMKFRAGDKVCIINNGPHAAEHTVTRLVDRLPDVDLYAISMANGPDMQIRADQIRFP